MKKVICILMCILIILAAAAGFLYYRYTLLDSSAIPVMAVNIAGQALSKQDVTWSIPFLNGLFKKDISETYDSPLNEIEITVENPQVVFAPKDADVHIIVYGEQDTVFDGDIQQFNSEFIFEQNGQYTIRADVKLKTEKQGQGTAAFVAQLNVNVVRPVKLDISNTVLPQGEAAVLTLTNIPIDAKISASSNLGYINFTPSEKENTMCAIVPVSYKREEGEYPIYVHVNDETLTANITVTAQEFEIQEMTIDTDIAQATVNSTAANTEFHNIIVPLYDTSCAEKYWYGSFLQPVEARVSTPYGVKRYVNGSSIPERHGGIDLAADLGTPIQCPNAGVVEYAGFLQLSGNTIVIEHGGGLKSYFYHMDSLNVQTGDTVEKADILGTVGTTGYSTGAHLHYEIKIGRESLNPWTLFDGSSPIIKLDE